MASPSKNLFVLGAKPHGVVIVRTDPGRVIHLSHEQFVKYASEYSMSVDTAYNQIEAILARILLDADAEVRFDEHQADGLQSLLYKQFKVTRADFAAVVEINVDFDEGGEARRRSFSPLGPVLEGLDPSEVNLEDFINSEIDPNHFADDADTD